MDKIFIRDLKVCCIIGVNKGERLEKQDVVINIDIFTDIRSAAESDNIENTVNYRLLKNRIIEMVEKSRFQLVEALAEYVAKLCLEDSRIEKVTVSVEKPGVLKSAKSAGVEITRSKSV